VPVLSRKVVDAASTVTVLLISHIFRLGLQLTSHPGNKHFETEKDMKYHKKYDPSHNYCKRCGVDCLDWEDLTQHKVEKMQPWLDGKMRDNKDESPAHIVCEFCGEDFKSFGGRKKHRDTYHQAEQTIICPGCGDIFVQASHLIEHFEKDKCTEISCRRYVPGHCNGIANRFRKSILASVLH
jgi:ribosomal protein L24E